MGAIVAGAVGWRSRQNQGEQTTEMGSWLTCPTSRCASPAKKVAAGPTWYEGVEPVPLSSGHAVDTDGRFEEDLLLTQNSQDLS